MRIKLANTLGMPLALLPDDRGTGGDNGEGGDGGNGGGAGRNGDGKTGTGKGGDGEKTFTQADVDKIVADRARRIARTDYGDYDDLKAKAAKLDEIEQANASETDKAVTKARTEAEAAVRAELMADRVLDKVEIAAAGTWADVTDARLRLQSRAGEFVDKKSGVIDTDAIKAAVADELKKAPHLAAAGTTSSRPRRDEAQGGGTGKPTRGQAGREEAARRFPKTTT